MQEELINKFAEEFTTDAEDEILHQIYRETHLKCVNPRMISGLVQGKILRLLSQLIRPDKILEIGTFTAYSAICLASGLSENGKLITIERNDELELLIRANINKSANKNKIKLIIGDAIKFMKQTEEKFDIVFIDGDKKEYLDYFILAEKIISKNATIIIDNIFWSGKIFEKTEKKDAQTKAIKELLEYLKKNKRFKKTIFPVRDGMLVLKKI